MVRRFLLLLILSGGISLSFTSGTYCQVFQGDTVQVVKFGAGQESGYSLLLPSEYNTARRYPLVIFLDPAARGDLPVNKYRQISNEQKIILAGSFGSRNSALHFS